MNTYQQRHERLLADRRLMNELAASSSILNFEAGGEVPDRYTLIFHGKGPASDTQGGVQVSDEHRCLVRLPFAYPQTGPDVQWLTPLLHPNIGYGGFLQLEDVGLHWHEDMGLDVVCERLWDVARLAYVNERAAVNSNAVGFLARGDWHLPLDERPLRDRAARQLKNIVRYKRRSDTLSSEAPHTETLSGTDHEPGTADRSLRLSARGNDVLFIGDEEAESSPPRP